MTLNRYQAPALAAMYSSVSSPSKVSRGRTRAEIQPRTPFSTPYTWGEAVSTQKKGCVFLPHTKAL